jgi:hypothetical protein
MMRVMPSSKYFHLQGGVNVLPAACIARPSASTHVALMSSRFGTGGIPILATIMQRGERPEVEKAEGGVKSDDALRLAWAD